MFRLAKTIAVFILLSFSAVMAQEKPTGLIKVRIDTMTAMGNSVGLMMEMIREKTPYDSQAATQAIDDIYNYSLEIDKQFPDTSESRTGNLTRANALIWDDRAAFDLLTEKLQFEAENSAQFAAMNKPDLMRPRMAEIVEICTECHEKFRTPKK